MAKRVRAPIRRDKSTAKPKAGRATKPAATREASPERGREPDPPRVRREQVEGLVIADLFQIDRNGQDTDAIRWFRGRYPRKLAAYQPTDEDIWRAREIVDLVAEAIIVGGEPQWNRLRRAHKIMRRMESKGPRIAACVEATITTVDIWHGDDARSHHHLPEGLIRSLAFYEPAFGKLRPELVRQELEQTKPRKAVSKGGKGNVGPLALAAKLALDVGAFGARQNDGERYEAAVKRVRIKLGNAHARASTPRR